MSAVPASEREYAEPTGWVGWIVFAAIMMVVSGSLNMIYGFVAAVNDEYVVFGNHANVYLDVSITLPHAPTGTAPAACPVPI